MRIYTNMTALYSNSYLAKADEKTALSIQRLSSGYKINRSEDSPVGKAISNKMKMQIRALDKASQSATDGISIVQTAEGALSEVESMLQRMSELAVQAASDTYTDEDRESIQNEINQLNEEIDRICSDTEFNGKSLLDGSLSRRGYAEEINGITQQYISKDVPAGRYGFIINAAPTAAEYASSGIAAATVPTGLNGSITINGANVTISAGESIDTIMDRIKEASAKGGFSLDPEGTAIAAGQSFSFVQDEYGSSKKIEISCSSDEIAAFMGVEKKVTETGTDMDITTLATSIGFKESVRYSVDGETVTFRDKSGFEMTLKVDADTFDNYIDDNGEVRVAYNVTSEGAMTIHLGAFEDQEINMEIQKVSTETLNIHNINLRTSAGASNAITSISEAISKVSLIRSQLGAYQNRLEASASNLAVMTENLTSSLSRIEDVDMASEMTEYTTQNVLAQAATSMLAQANQAPEKVLQLLQ